MFVKCPCQHCNEFIEFEASELAEDNSVIPCPHCGLETKLFIPQATVKQEKAPSNTCIFLQVQDEKRGPYAKSQIQTMWNNGLITSDTLYWREGMADWGDISDLVEGIAASTPAPNVSKQAVPGANVANMIELAKAAATANNYKEAYDYYTKVLEFDPTNPNVWAGKGEAAGWLSSLRDIRTPEMIAAFNNAISYAAESDKPDFRKYGSDVINRVTSTCFGMAKKHLLQFARVSGTWPDYVKLCGLLISALEVGYLYDPDNKTTIENIIHISKDNIEGHSYSPDRIGLLSKKFSVTPQYETLLRTKIDEYTVKMYRLDPNFVKPRV